MNRNRLRAWLAALAFILTGAALGAILTLAAVAGFMRHINHLPPGARPPIARLIDHECEALAKEMDASPAEAAAMKAEAERLAPQIRAARTEMITKVEDEITASITKFGQAMPAERRAKLYRLCTERFHDFGLEFRPAAAP